MTVIQQDNDRREGDALEPTPFDTEELALTDGEERLPWLETGEEDYQESNDAGRMIAFVVGGLALLAAVIFGIYKLTHNRADPALAVGSVIEAPAAPYKTAPASPGGKPMAGTGDTSYAVSAGQTRQPKLGDAPVKATSTPAPNASSSAASTSTPAAAAGPGVQIGAFSSEASAEGAWARLSGQYAPLKGLSHRVVSGSADIGTVYRLQAVAGDAAAANALCGKLHGAGLACQVK